MDNEKQDEKKCIQCGEKGGRRRVDPYALELNGERVIVRLHDRCVGLLCDEI